ncbi:MAG: phosphate ABC transporter substrate-binding protein PstS [Solirubrobacteraceae bacterium]
MIKNKLGAFAACATVALGLSACASSTSTSAGTGSDATLVGAGSTLVAPLVSQWQPAYDKKTKVALTYGAIGSGGGIEQTTARTVDFGASDAPLSESQFKEAKAVVQIPWALTATVIAYHVQGVPNQLKLTGGVLAEIYEGKLSTWNAAAIAKLNPDVKLPATEITPIHRSDGSGDTFALTDYLSQISPEWKSTIGNGTEVSFPTGVGGKGNSGVGGAISATNGSIGYLAIAYVLANKFDYALIQNAAGNYPVPGIPSVSAAAKALKSVPANNEVSIVNPPTSAPDAYPISTFTYAIVPLASPKASTLKPFLKWAITEGQQFGPKLDFAPLPQQVVTADEATIEQIKA